jgi:hypothetical protein
MRVRLDMGVSYLQVRGDVFLAYVLQTAAVALWLSRCTCVSSVKYEPVVCPRPQFRCESFGQVALDCLYSGAVRQADAARNPEYMGVYGDYRLVVYDRSDHIGSLSSDSWQCLKLRRL